MEISIHPLDVSNLPLIAFLYANPVLTRCLWKYHRACFEFQIVIWLQSKLFQWQKIVMSAYQQEPISHVKHSTWVNLRLVRARSELQIDFAQRDLSLTVGACTRILSAAHCALDDVAKNKMNKRHTPPFKGNKPLIKQDFPARTWKLLTRGSSKPPLK